MLYVAVTGHRPKKLIPEGESWSLSLPLVREYGMFLRESLLAQAGYNTRTKEWERRTPVTLITGMALGFDTVAALVTLKLKKEFPDLFFLQCAIPCKGQEIKWSKKDQESYHNILKQADEVVMVSNESYTNGCMQKRNEFMVDQAHVILSSWNGEKSGTGNCIKYAKKLGKSVENIQPITLKKETL